MKSALFCNIVLCNTCNMPYVTSVTRCVLQMLHRACYKCYISGAGEGAKGWSNRRKRQVSVGVEDVRASARMGVG